MTTTLAANANDNITQTIQELRTLLQEKREKEQELVEHVINNSFLVLESLEEIPQEYLKVDLAITKDKLPKTRAFLDERWEKLAATSTSERTSLEKTEALSSLMRGLYLVSHKGTKRTLLGEGREQVFPCVVEGLSTELTEELRASSNVLHPIKKVPVSLTEAQNIVLTEAFTDLFKSDSVNTKQFTNSMNQIRNLAQMGKMNELAQSVNGAIQKFEQVMSTQPTGVGNAINIQREKARQIGYTMNFITILNSFFQSLKDVTVNMPTLNGVLNDQNMDQNSKIEEVLDPQGGTTNAYNLRALLTKQLNQAVNGGWFKQAIKGMFSKLGSAIKGMFKGGDKNLTAGQPTDDQQLLPELKPKSPNETFRFFGTSTEQIVNDIMKMTVGDFKKIMGLAQQLKEPDIQPDNNNTNQQQQNQQAQQQQQNPDEMQTVRQIVTLSQSLSDDAKQQIVAALTA